MSPGEVCLRVPRSLAAHLGDATEVRLPLPADATVRGVLDALTGAHPGLDRRVRTEAGELRRHVNVYVDGEDVRRTGGLDTAVPAGAEVQVLQSIAGG
ncbi:molybdopterin synthase sulfur carrier subunit [Modestobacter sp. I12A-02628]|uniref:MoaD/ThiS family protein n=1 Tax=Goekera deserti TaxID=2497753 RepID=A0A7K3WCV6_9ACTN|nr:ubiquitin-like small modifier protein 1 [Goekera deserti]MPQ97534.1 molybdopterin synthase sulfur carrier subunit [Goekera deserti]NDI47862.1 molybdopterin synthase sulfur carrier subunit [Goekera deserti]NEL53610.1 MoaD/ThiS family protein [Goekera deserti]